MNEATLLELWEAYQRLHILIYGKPPTQRISSKDDMILAICDLRSLTDIDDDDSEA
jgi:hypothetical protein